MRPRLLHLVAGCLAWLALGLPGATATDSRQGKELLVLGAASLRDVIEVLARDFEATHSDIRVRLSFAGSQALRAQIERGGSADLFVSADVPTMDRLQQLGLARSPVVVARNRPVVITSRDGPVLSFVELPRARRLVVGAPEVPIGGYTLGILSTAGQQYGAHFRSAVESRIVSRELSARHVLARVVLGQADAGIVYATDALAAADKVRVVDIPPALNPTARYPAALLAAAKEPDLAGAFLALLRSPHGQTRFRAAGFLPAEDEVSP